MTDRDRALQVLLSRYRHDEAMRLYGEYCLLIDEPWEDFVARHAPVRLRQLHRQLGAVGLWPADAPALQTGTGLLIAAAGKAITGMLSLGKPEHPPGEPEAPLMLPEALPRAHLELGKNPDQLLHTLATPPLIIELSPELHEHTALALPEGPLTDAAALSRYRVAQELGFVFPLVPVVERVGLPPDGYAIRLNGEVVAEGQAPRECVAAVGTDLPGAWPREPHPARDRTEMTWLTVSAARAWDGELQTAAELIGEHFEGLVRKHAYRLFNNQALDVLLRAYEPEIGKDTYAELFGRFMSLTELRLVLQGLLRQGHSIRPLPRIIDTLLAHFIATLADKPVPMEESWKLTSHAPILGTAELVRIVCNALGYPYQGGGSDPDALAALERAFRGADHPGKGAC